ncbi:hypothetical protein INT80_05700 [Gallibacterium anatis]|uniref:Uncharacterized protein n=1 Tax=Gallibacterium anatis TaxID=750 RepID=A0A930URA5_9PAST|nr:hypothetical protein [Gallibacterium anatis]
MKSVLLSVSKRDARETVTGHTAKVVIQYTVDAVRIAVCQCTLKMALGCIE